MLKIIWKDFNEEGRVVFTRNIGKAKMYKLNLPNPIIKKFRDFYWETTKQRVHEEIKKQKTKKLVEA